MRRRVAVLGSPIAHSLSPVLHRRAYDVLGLNSWSYEAHEVVAAELPAFVAGLDDSWAGLSLTMPLKAAVLPLLAVRTPLVDAVAAANTVVFVDGQLQGDNTDVPGLVACLQEAGITGFRDAPAGVGGEAAVLGAGATARSAVAALGHLGFAVTVFARNPARREELARTAHALDVALDVRPWEEVVDGLSLPLVVNTTPRGVTDPLQSSVPAHPGLLFEVLYAPWPTPLVAAWIERSGRAVGGLELLVQQAVRQVALMTGLTFPLDALANELRVAGRAALPADT